MITNRVLSVGTRVHVKGNPSGITLRATIGTIVRRDDMDGYYIIRLDKPALVYDVPDPGEEISEIVETADNLEVMPPDR